VVSLVDDRFKNLHFLASDFCAAQTRINSSVFPQNIEPQITSTDPVSCFITAPLKWVAPIVHDLN
jgi:hypothetical protein